jgi:hypothetical protein
LCLLNFNALNQTLSKALDKLELFCLLFKLGVAE